MASFAISVANPTSFGATGTDSGEFSTDIKPTKRPWDINMVTCGKVRQTTDPQSKVTKKKACAWLHVSDSNGASFPMAPTEKISERVMLGNLGCVY
jgi:hypothetical protein